MAELLIFTTNTIGDDVYKNAKLPKRGDVITVQEDGWNWGIEELSDPRFLVLKVPKELAVTFKPLTSMEVPTELGTDAQMDATQVTNTLQYRGFHIDLDALQLTMPQIAALVISKPVDGAVKLVSVAPAPVEIPDAATLLAFKVQKLPIADPAIIEAPLSIIG